MSKDNIIKLIQPGNVEDQLTEILRNGARCLLAQAVEAEVADFLGKHADLKTEDGHQRVVRHDGVQYSEVSFQIILVATNSDCSVAIGLTIISLDCSIREFDMFDF